MKIGIIGYGEIGKALEELYLDNNIKPRIKDIYRDDYLHGCDILNISIPYSSEFVSVVIEYIETLCPKTVVIHSTVYPGTTNKISETFPSIVHSPVRGVHPNLLDGLKTFPKAVAGNAALEVSRHFVGLGLQVDIFDNTITTEVAKLLDTTYYGVCIAWHDYANTLCKELGANFSQAMTSFNTSYNEGYKILGKENVVRPVLYPPEKSIGGHCVVPNAGILKKVLPSDLLEVILKLK